MKAPTEIAQNISWKLFPKTVGFSSTRPKSMSTVALITVVFNQFQWVKQAFHQIIAYLKILM